MRRLRVADHFCGAGGFSTALFAAAGRLGLEVDLTAVNHWPVAIESHQANHPGARHLVADIRVTAPLDAAGHDHLDLLIAAPSCVFFSRARGGKPTSDQQRVDPWEIARLCAHVRVDRLIVENVPELQDWGPVDLETGKPVPSRKGQYFRQWIASLRQHFPSLDWRVLNAADFGDATTRHRFFLQGRADGRPIAWPEPSHAPSGVTDLFGRREGWRAAAEIIDWSLQGRSIYERPKPLAPKTLLRIRAGMIRTSGMAASAIFLDRLDPEIARSQAYHAAGPEAREALRRVTRDRADDVAGGFVGTPFLVKLRGTSTAAAAGGPLPALSAGGTHLALAQPYVIGQHGGAVPRATSEPLPTIATGGAIAFVTPYYGGGSGNTGKSVDGPLDTITTLARHALVEPLIVDSVMSGDDKSRAARLPLRTQTSRRSQMLVEPFLVPLFGERPGQAPRSHGVDRPLPAITGQGAGSLVTAHRTDILLRMLTNAELAAATGFPKGYRFAGSTRDVTRQIGNAVPVNLGTALLTALLGDVAAEAAAA